MTENQYWLPHLENAVPLRGYGNRLSMYLIALESWRRGLKVKFFSLDNPDNKMLIRYSIGNENIEYHFESSRGEKLTQKAFEICENKDETKKILSQVGIPVPKGRRFKSNINDKEVIEYGKSLGFPIVVKPVGERAGKGVFSNIKNVETLIDVINHVRYELGYMDIILEEHINGVEHRVLIVNEEVLGVVKRVPANIVGDGIHSIQELINLKNASKKNNPNVSKKIIKIDKEVLDSIKLLGYTLDSIPKKGEQVFLRNKSNVSAGGDAVDVTDEFPESLKDVARNAANTIPGLSVCGLDMIVDLENSIGVIIEINTKPMLGLHVFPEGGKPRDVIKHIVDFYFPETKQKKKTNLYFDFETALAPLKARLVKEIEIQPPLNLDKIYAKRFLVTGINLGKKYKNEIRLEALKQKIHGYIKETKKDQIEVIVAHSDRDIINDFTNICYNGQDGTKVISIQEYEWTKPVKIGFDIYPIPQMVKKANRLKSRLEKEQALKAKLTNNLLEERQKVNNFKEQLEREKEKIKKIKEEKNKVIRKKSGVLQEKKQLQLKYNNIISSRSWKVTKPLRKFMSLIKKQ